MRKICLSALVFLTGSLCFAQNVDLATATKVADNYRHQIRPNQSNTISNS